MTRFWKTETLYFDGDAYYADIYEAINQARSSIVLETYIYDPDETGLFFEQILNRAAARGVQIRVLVDGIGSAAWVERRAPEFVKSGCQVRIYHPVKFASLFRRFLIDIGVRRRAASKSSRVFSRLNRRNHRKMCIIDGQTAWVGSMNISDVHSRKKMGPMAWRDTAVKVEGEEVSALIAGFEYAWIRSHSTDGKRQWRQTFIPHPELTRIRSAIVRSNYTLPLRRRHYVEFARRIRTAQTRIWITNAYLAPSLPVLRRLARAALRGVDVRILVPRNSDVFFMPWVASAHYGALISEGVKIYEYLPGFLHAKSVVIDNWCTVGSSNLNRRSLLRDFEVDVVVKNSNSILLIEKQFLQDLQSSEEIHVAPTGLRALLGKIIIYLMKQWI